VEEDIAKSVELFLPELMAILSILLFRTFCCPCRPFSASVEEIS